MGSDWVLNIQCCLRPIALSTSALLESAHTAASRPRRILPLLAITARSYITIDTARARHHASDNEALARATIIGLKVLGLSGRRLWHRRPTHTSATAPSKEIFMNSPSTYIPSAETADVISEFMIYESRLANCQWCRALFNCQ